MKKLCCLILACILITCSLLACDSTGDGEETTTAAATSTESTAPEKETKPITNAGFYVGMPYEKASLLFPAEGLLHVGSYYCFINTYENLLVVVQMNTGNTEVASVNLYPPANPEFEDFEALREGMTFLEVMEQFGLGKTYASDVSSAPYAVAYHMGSGREYRVYFSDQYKVHSVTLATGVESVVTVLPPYLSFPGYSWNGRKTSVLTVEQASAVKEGMHFKEVFEVLGPALCPGYTFGINSEMYLLEDGTCMTIGYFGDWVGWIKTGSNEGGAMVYSEFGDNGKFAATNAEELAKIYFPNLVTEAE